MNSRRAVWAITTIRRQKNEGRFRDSRTVGIVRYRKQATRLVEGNYGDLEEAGWYQYAVVEPIRFGLYPFNHAADRIWYEWIGGRDGRWTRLGKLPQALKDEYRIGGPRGPLDLTNWSRIG